MCVFIWIECMGGLINCFHKIFVKRKNEGKKDRKKKDVI
jgi:hypothetical protein